MRSRDLFLAVVAVVLLLAVQWAWWARPAGRRVPATPSLPLLTLGPVATQTGQVIPADPHMSGGTIASIWGTSIARSFVQPGHKPPSAAPPFRGQATPAVNAPSIPEREAAIVEAGKVRRMIGDYHTLMGQNPVGTNAEIMQALMGGNPRQAMLGPPEGQSLNEKGELVDQWGTPYFFHQLSGDRMEIYSAGPDKILGTADDIVVK